MESSDQKTTSTYTRLKLSSLSLRNRIKSNRGKILIVIGIVFGFIFSGLGGYYLGIQQSDSRGELMSDLSTEESDTLCGIEKIRLSEPIIYGENKYYIYKRNSLNVPIIGRTENYTTSGVFVMGDDQPENCKKLIEIIDQEQAKNNVYEIVIENNEFYVLAVDHLGAGSGEGQAKILKSNDDGKTWALDFCFYYTPEEWKSLNEFLKNKKMKIEPDERYCNNFALSVEGGRLR